jgi:hypothetical protein
MLAVVMAISLFWVAASAFYVEHWWSQRKERQLQARMQAALDALDD